MRKITDENNIGDFREQLKRAYQEVTQVPSKHVESSGKLDSSESFSQTPSQSDQVNRGRVAMGGRESAIAKGLIKPYSGTNPLLGPAPISRRFEEPLKKEKGNKSTTNDLQHSKLSTRRSETKAKGKQPGTRQLQKTLLTQKSGHIRKLHANPLPAESQKISRSAILAVRRPHKALAHIDPKPIVHCLICRERIYAYAMQLHLRNLHANKPDTQFRQSSVIRLPFVLLPSGVLAFEGMDGYDRGYGKTEFFSSSVDPNRMRYISKLKPLRIYQGKKAWSEYAAFEFAFSDRVLLESPLRANAAYILSSEWREMISLNKAVIREEYSGRYTRVVHTGSAWPARIHKALSVG